MQDGHGNPITVSVSNSFSTGNVIIIYTSDSYLSPDDKIEFTNLNGDDTYYMTTRSVSGKKGWNTIAGINYNIIVYAMLFCNVLSKHRRLAIKDKCIFQQARLR